MNLYPLRLTPEFKHRIWGTRDLSPFFGEAPGTEAIGEVWLTGEECRVAHGPLAGRTLGDLAQEFGRDLVGATAPEERRFPLLLKFLYPREKLSVQVHPDDATAKKSGLPCGKTECWYVLQAQPGAQVGLGLKPGTTREEFERAIREVRAEQLLNWIDVHQGDMIYVDAGTVHAIAPGSVLLETQQNSDTTYRLYDYGRPRELHIEQGMAAMKEKTGAGKIRSKSGERGWFELIDSACFRVESIALRNGRAVDEANQEHAAQVLVALEGSAVIECAGGPLSINKAEAVVLPASVREFSIRGQWSADVLRAMVPAK
jgi:mannose-6-phosphate isomerase